MAAQLEEILAYLGALLEPDRFDDYCVNGLQVPGPREVSVVATGVSAHAELFELAAAERADLLLVHHGLFWGDGVRSVDALLKYRLQLLFDADIALVAYHLPLDAHPDAGNNALLAGALGASVRGSFAQHRGEPIGVIAELPAPGIPFPELLARVAAACASDPLAFDSGPEQVRTVAIVTGAGADFLDEAAAARADALITGEVAERHMALAREQGLHLIAAGHYATETFGVRRLGQLLVERFGVRHAFLDVPNPV